MGLKYKSKPSPQRHQYALTVCDMLMNYIWCIPLFTKEADEAVHDYLVNGYSELDGCKILSNNDTEFGNNFLYKLLLL